MVSFKVHLVCEHLEDYLEELGSGLALYSEQAGESLHADFRKTWLHYLVKNPDVQSYAGNVFKATVAYNSSHI